jgi:ppGpp synthetase/RelA/SpoT-type nucleotidyltranferase
MDLEAARKRWLIDKTPHEHFGVLIRTKLEPAIREKGIWCQTDSRAKETHSLIKKLLRGKHTYDTLPDKTGARCIVRFRIEFDAIVHIAEGLFECSTPDRKQDQLGYDRVGYDSIHVEVRLRPEDKDARNYPPASYWAELQIRTLAQHLWSEMAHDSVYKSDETLAELPADIRRRAYLMAGLIEVADREFDRLSKEHPLNPNVLLYKTLERHYFKLTAKRPDPALSLQVIDLLSPLYGLQPNEIVERIDAFFASHESVLHTVYAAVEESATSALLYQPKSLCSMSGSKPINLLRAPRGTQDFPKMSSSGLLIPSACPLTERPNCNTPLAF